MDKHRMRGMGILRRGMTAVCAAVVLMLCCPFVSRADSTGKVSVEAAKIRERADTDSNSLGSVSRGATLTIIDEVTDASGKLWYQVYVDANTTGYVRADLVTKEAGSEDTAQTSSDDGSASGDGQAENTMDAQYATVTVEVAKIRSAPSTNDSVVERVARGAQVIVSGQSNGTSDGKVWYYVTVTAQDGSQKTGYVRSDLVTLGDMVPVSEEQPAPEEPVVSEPQETVSQDYEVIFKEGEWYLRNNLEGYDQRLQPLLDMDQQQNDTADADAKKLVKQRIAIVVLAALAVVLIVVIIIMAIKLRDVYYEEYDDDEDEEEDDDEVDEDVEEEPVRRRRREEEEESVRESERPVRRTAREPEAPSRRVAREPQERSVQTAPPRAKSSAQRKPKNFLLDDDEFEFEFLNMDDKGL